MSIRVIASEHLIDANNDLQAQNERQRKQLASLNAAYGRIKSENDQLKAENAKLRKLVKEAHLCMVNEGCCEDCYATYGECPIEMDMRELRIEASNGQEVQTQGEATH